MMMKNILKRTLSTLMFCCLLAITATFASAQDSSQSTAPDNTKVNDRDKSKSEPTADQQKNDKSDQDITQQIRKSVMSDKSLSTYAHNVKIISQNGMVTLKGPVRSADEKAAVESKAAAVVGEDKVTSELEVKPKQ
jgi:hyperosmotically inducible periplasmic protein